MGRAPYSRPLKRRVRRLIEAEAKGELKKHTKYPINKFRRAAGAHWQTLWGDLRGDLTKEEMKEKGGTEPPILEINDEFRRQGSPLEYRKCFIRVEGGILYGCEPGPLGRVRWPILPRQRAWRRTRPTPFLDRLEWRLNRPNIL